MRLPFPLLASALSLGLGLASAQSATAANEHAAPPDRLRLLQRIYHPSKPDEPFVDRGAILLSYPSTHAVSHGPVAASFVSSEEVTLNSYVTAFAESVQSAEAGDATVDVDAAWYQLALEHPGDTHPSQWHVSAVKACHLPLATAESFTLHLSITGEPFALDYFVGPVPHDGRCPGTKKARRRAMSEVGTRITNSTVLLKSPTHPPLPQLRTPPPLTPEGKPVVPPQEKTFLQKYWMYFALGFLALAMSGGPAEEEGQGGGGGQRR